MADEKKVAEEKTEKSEKAKKPSFSERASKMLRDYKSEFKKIVWPTWKFTWKQSVMVILAIVLISASIFVVDTVFSKLLGFIVGLISA